MKKNELIDKICDIIDAYTTELDFVLDEDIDNFKDNSILKTTKSIAINHAEYKIKTDILHLIYEEMD